MNRFEITIILFPKLWWLFHFGPQIYQNDYNSDLKAYRNIDMRISLKLFSRTPNYQSFCQLQKEMREIYNAITCVFFSFTNNDINFY